MKLRPFFLWALGIVLLGSCHSGAPSVPSAEEERDTASFQAVGVFLEGQLKKMELPGTALTTYRSHNGKSDSAHLATTEPRHIISPFLRLGNQVDHSRYTRSVFQDSTHHETIVSYEAVSDSDAFNRVDVFTDAATGVIRQLYLQYIDRVPDSTIRLQLIWKTDQDFTLITTIDRNQFTADLRKQKVVWNRP
jgi:hypothetical protein